MVKIKLSKIKIGEKSFSIKNTKYKLLTTAYVDKKLIKSSVKINLYFDKEKYGIPTTNYELIRRI